MKCSMCDTQINEEFDGEYKITTPEDMQRDVCGRCYMLVKINDNLELILEVLKDGRLRIA